MNCFRNTATVMIAGAVCMVGVQPIHADEWNKKTVMTISEPLQVPNKVLDPGKYMMKLLDSPSDRHIVQIFNEDGSKLITTILAIPNYRLKPTGKTEFNFWEVPAGQPSALRAWFYPGDNFGQEFAYPPGMSGQLSKYNKTSMPTTYAESDKDLSTAKVEQTTVEPMVEASAAPAPAPAPAPEPTPVAAAPAPEPAPVAAAAASPEPMPAPQAASSNQSELPHTASTTPALALVGLASFGFYLMLTARRRRSQ